MDTDTAQLLRSTLTQLLGEPSERPLSDRLSDLGWGEALSDDAALASRILFETKGEFLGAGDALGPLLARALAISLATPDLAAASIVLPASLRPIEPVATTHAHHMTVSGVMTSTPAPGVATAGLVRSPGGMVRIGVFPPRLAWHHAALGGTDPALGLVRVDAVVDEGDVVWTEPEPSVTAWSAAVAAGRWALGAELVGVGRHVIGEAVAYAGERRQYGRAIGTFQALQHRLASAHAAVVGASRVVAEAAASGSEWAALVAKALSGRAAESACTQAQQTFGAIGFTWEHPLHRYLRRTYILDRLLGDWRALEAEIGARLQEDRVVPRVGDL
ncbi:MAG: acyl-CoA dehydrogenase family protein [Acidimicrobiales bacterium]